MEALERSVAAEQRIQDLDLDGAALDSDAMTSEFRRRNSFGIDPQTRISRIWRRDFLESDIEQGRLSLARAGPNAWNDPLKNPLAKVRGTDDETGLGVDSGASERRAADALTL